ncbi:hypothetical protein GIB67_036440 [Kingdonia uniflora]|uniref:CRM domain-containing protein n=1 Tax=Kingdonia uniflora TaxID=39325 RepID=A0A7J7L487_9MAGN|nr:hypothetical protein GIB67_036440 [Kingdonia uniflora]
MAFSTAKFTELPLHSSFLFSSPKPSSLSLLLHLKPLSSSLRSSPRNPRNHPTKQQPRVSPPSSSSSPWLNKWPPINPSPSTPTQTDSIPKKRFVDNTEEEEIRYFEGGDKGRSAIERIVHRLRNLGLDSDGEEGDNDDDGVEGVDDIGSNEKGEEEKLGDLLQRKWVRPDTIMSDDDDDDDDDEGSMVLPWERGDNVGEGEKGRLGGKKKRVSAPSLAELTIEDQELRRLRTVGMTLRERISVPKAGVTQMVLEKIHEQWRKSELVRLKFHEDLAHDMRTAHELVERRTGGLIIWRSGSVMVVYRGTKYERPYLRSQSVVTKGETLFIPDVSSTDHSVEKPILEKTELSVMNPVPVESMTEEETEYNKLLDGLGPRFTDWWGTGLLPIDADLLPRTLPGYKTPFRLLANRMRSRLTNSEMTDLRKLAKSLPCHFALGRNRDHQGLAAAIVKLWDQSLVVKIAVKRGIQNTNNKLMAEELKKLTGGLLLLRNKYYIVIYRGKDFLPKSVAAALSERQKLTKGIQDVEEKVRIGVIGATPTAKLEGKAIAGTLAEFREAQARWGREISADEHEKMKEGASRAKNARVVKRIEHKLVVAQTKKLRAERLLAKIEISMVPASPSDDQETITDEERFMFRRVGLRMKAYLPLGIRGVFDGVIENMHLHWKHRELVKLISKQKTLSFVEDTARLLEYESGGILVTIERVPKGYALIYYRGKNYQRPISLRPRNLLTKAKALKRSVAMQRHEALSQHISELEGTIEEMSSEIGEPIDVATENIWNSREDSQFNHVSEYSQSEDKGYHTESSDISDDNDYDDIESENDDDYDDIDSENDEASDFPKD